MDFILRCKLTGSFSYSENVGLYILCYMFFSTVSFNCLVYLSSGNPQGKYRLDIVCGSFSCVHI